MRLRLFLFFCVFMPILAVCEEDVKVRPPSSSEQVIEDFSVTGSDEDKRSNWKLNGNVAKVKGDFLEVDKVNVDAATDRVTVKVKSEKGYYDQKKGVVLLSKNVEAKASTGTEFYTDSAVWDSKKNVLETDKPIKILQPDKGASLEGVGGKVKLSENVAIVNKNVVVSVDKRKSSNMMSLPVGSDNKVEKNLQAGPRETAVVTNNERKEKNKRHKTIIRCKGPLEVRYKDKIAVFNNNVVVKDEEATIYAKKLTVYFDSPDNKIRKIVAEGNVRVVKGDNITESEKAIYDVETQSLTMTGQPKVLFYTGDEIGKAAFGDKRFS